jgi:hypothetical protein
MHLCEAASSWNHQSEVLVQMFRRFTSDDQRALAWFDTFSPEGFTRSGPGAITLASFFIDKRDQYWHLLEWKGRSHSPSMCIQDSGAWFDLDVLGTMHALLQRCDPFWQSSYLLSGRAHKKEWLKIDPAFSQSVRMRGTLCLFHKVHHAK